MSDEDLQFARGRGSHFVFLVDRDGAEDRGDRAERVFESHVGR